MAVGDQEKSTGTRAEGARCGVRRAERGAHEEKAESNGRSGVRVGLARARSAHRVTKDRSRAIFLKFVAVVTVASLRRCQPKRHAYPMRLKRHVTILHPGNRL